MFNVFKTKNKLKKSLVSPMSGEVVSIREMPDEVFSELILGDGFSVIPNAGEIKSPVNGVVTQIADTLHCWCIKSEDGLEILIHVGVDTVNLKGEGFKSYVSSGKKVQTGDIIGNADLEFIEKKGLYTHTAVIISNMNKIKKLDKKLSSGAKAGETIVLEYEFMS